MENKQVSPIFAKMLNQFEKQMSAMPPHQIPKWAKTAGDAVGWQWNDKPMEIIKHEKDD